MLLLLEKLILSVSVCVPTIVKARMFLRQSYSDGQSVSRRPLQSITDILNVSSETDQSTGIRQHRPSLFLQATLAVSLCQGLVSLDSWPSAAASQQTSQTETDRDRQTETDRDRQTERQGDRQRQRQTDRDRQRQTRKQHSSASRSKCAFAFGQASTLQLILQTFQKESWPVTGALNKHQ